MNPSYRVVAISPTLTVPAGLIEGDYVASDEPEWIRDTPPVLAFGRVGLEGRIGIDMSSGAIVHVPTAESALLNPVNATLEQFCRCVEAVIERYPFDADPSADMDEVAEELRRMLARIDIVTTAHNGFWETFTDDVAIGDYLSDPPLHPADHPEV
jgi:hypothetical protein